MMGMDEVGAGRGKGKEERGRGKGERGGKCLLRR